MNVDVVRHNARVGREIGEIGERTGVTEARGKICRRVRAISEAPNAVIDVIGEENVAVAWITAKCRHAGFGSESMERHRVRGAVRAQIPDVSAHNVSENIRALQFRKSLAAIHESASDGVALI